jgi:membrane protease YdiL (CAAX protease family)
MMGFVRERIPPLCLFVALAYAFSWLLWSPVVVSFPDVANPPSWVMVLAFVGAYGPSVAAIAAAGIYGGRPEVASLLSRLRRWRVGWKWYAVILFAPPAFVWIGAGIFVALGGTINGLRDDWPLRAAVIVASYLPIGPLGEELGWRGYALPRLETRWAPLTSSIILGFIWVGWHVPLFWLPGAGLPYGSTRSLETVATWGANVLSFSILLSFAVRQTRYSVVVAILLHAMLNAAADVGLAALIVSPQDAVQIQSWARVFRWAVVAAAAVALARDRRAAAPHVRENRD